MFAAFTVTASAVRAPCAMHSRTAQPHQSARIAAFSTGAGRRELALSTARRQGPSRHGVAARKIEATAHRANVQATATEVDEKEAVCYLRGVRMSASKVRRVLDVIRGKSYEECLIMLEFMPYRSCEPILNALFSAASNAKNNLGMNKAKLYVSECYADGGATMKRFQPRAQGRPFAIRKRTCSLVLKMKERED